MMRDWRVHYNDGKWGSITMTGECRVHYNEGGVRVHYNDGGVEGPLQ